RQMRQFDAIARPVRKWRIGLALTPEVGPDLYGPPDIDDHQERRPFVQRLGVALRLALGRPHQTVPGLVRQLCRLSTTPGEQLQLSAGIQFAATLALARLFGLQNEAVAAIAVDVVDVPAAILMAEPHGPF